MKIRDDKAEIVLKLAQSIGDKCQRGEDQFLWTIGAADIWNNLAALLSEEEPEELNLLEATDEELEMMTKGEMVEHIQRMRENVQTLNGSEDGKSASKSEVRVLEARLENAQKKIASLEKANGDVKKLKEKLKERVDEVKVLLDSLRKDQQECKRLINVYGLVQEGIDDAISNADAHIDEAELLGEDNEQWM